MVGAKAIPVDVQTSFRWWFLPSWLGLDAPCVVLTWCWAVSESFELIMKVCPAAAIFLVVWSIYMLDRLIDVSLCPDWQRATGRSQFGRRYGVLFLACLAGCITGVTGLLESGLPSDVLWQAALG